MNKRVLGALVLLAIVSQGGAGESYVKNEQERARIEAALPAKASARPVKARRLLIFTLNVGYGGHPSMAHANEAFTLMGRKTGAFETVVSNDPQVFARESLNTFDAVFFNNTVGNCFTNADLRRNLVEFVLGGGGLLGVHGTTVAFTKWPGAIEDWPEFGFMIGARGANHKDSDEHIWMKLDDPQSPILSVFGGQGFDFRDEFFRPQGTYNRERVRVLLSIDTSKSDPEQGQARGDCYRADHDYAVAWIRTYGKGRVFYCTIAHNPYVFWDAKMLSFYLAALQFALGDLPCPTTPSARVSPGVRTQEQLGWRLAMEEREGGASTFRESAQRAGQLGLPYVIGSGAQQVGAHLLRPLDPQLADAGLEQVRLDVEKASVRLLAYTVAKPPADEAEVNRLFAFGKKLGIETFMLALPPKDIGLWEKAADAFDTYLALLVKTRADAVALANLCRERGKHLGMALDLSDTSWSGDNLSRAVDAIGNRLFYVRLSDPAPSALAQIRSSGAKPIFAIEPAQNRDSIEKFNAATLRLARP